MFRPGPHRQSPAEFLGRAFILFITTLLLFTSCAGPRPTEDMVLANTALEAARVVGATSVAPGFWHRAEESYRKGLNLMKGNYNYEAKEAFIEAREYAEKAENSTRLKKFKSGEAFP